MSRIHEALKRAEQERASPPLREGGAEGAELPRDAKFTAARPPKPEAAAVATETLPGEITIEMLKERCRQPRWNPDPKTTLLFNSDNHALGSEELRTLRSRLYQTRDRQPLRTLLVTSALPSEGKTFLTANLAHMIVRQHGRRVLVMDCDLRRSQLYAALGAPPAPGMTDYLLGQADEFSVIQRGPTDNLFFIPGGKTVANPSELIAGGRLKAFLDRLVPLFDWVLIDSPPAVAVSDASVMADWCDGVLLVVLAGSTPFDLVQKVRDEFRQKRLLGVILNQVQPGQGYHSYYSSYYGKSSKSESKR